MRADDASAVAGGSPYDDFAADYHWIVPDEQLSGERFLRLYRSVLDELAPGASVLDCACGPGYDALTLARAGYAVTASDASAAMVSAALELLESEGQPDITVRRCQWLDLADVFTERFEGVFCVGNSISHCADGAAMVAAFARMYDVLQPGGALVVEARDWARMRAERQRFEVREHVARRNGERGFCVYVWTIPDGWDEPHRAEILVVVEGDRGLRHHSVELSFGAFRREDLLDRLEVAGLTVESVTAGLAGRYVVTARRRQGPT
jgi:SAM-dependent methyltransferase